MQRFLDRDGSMLALRADMTLAVARLMGTRLHDCPLPQRFCYAGSVFRDVEPQAGQQREFWQAGVELIGSSAPEADAEVLALTAEALAATGLHEFRIVVGQMQYFDGLLQALALPVDLRQQLQTAIDRNSEAELASFLHTASLAPAQRAAVSELPTLSGGDLPHLLARASQLSLNETMRAAVDYLLSLFAVLRAYGVDQHCVLDLTEIHNLGYYTGITFEVLAPGVGFRLASGGRYDQLVGTFGPPQPAVGVAFGLERMLLAKQAGLASPPRPVAPDLLVSTANDPACLAIIAAARRAGLRVAVELEHRHGDQLWAVACRLGVAVALDWRADGPVFYSAEPAGVRREPCTPDAAAARLAELAQALLRRGSGGWA